MSALVLCAEGLLLARRAIAPREGYWTSPGGFLEEGETMAEGARRETREETSAEVRISGSFATIELPHIAQVHRFFLAEPIAEVRLDRPGPESDALCWCPLDELQSRELAFPSLELVARWLKNGRGQVEGHEAVLAWDGAGPRFRLASYEIRETGGGSR